jgi:hypothetical protein
MAAPRLLALHRDVQVLGCDCEGCTGLGDSEYVAETRASLDAGLPPEITEPPPVADHVHYPSFEVLYVRYSAGVPYGIHPCAVCGVAMERR